MKKLRFIKVTEKKLGIINTLVKDGRGDGHRFVQRIKREWKSGQEKFDKRGEEFLVVKEGGKLVAMGGISVDPYTNRSGVGRLRHLYVRRNARQRGIAERLVKRLLRRSKKYFQIVRLKTENSIAAQFYKKLHFHSVKQKGASHVFKYD